MAGLCSEVGVACLWWVCWSYLWKAGKAGLCSEVGVACLWWVCWSYLWKAGKAGLCSEVGVASLRQRTFWLKWASWHL